MLGRYSFFSFTVNIKYLCITFMVGLSIDFGLSSTFCDELIKLLTFLFDMEGRSKRRFTYYMIYR